MLNISKFFFAFLRIFTVLVFDHTTFPCFGWWFGLDNYDVLYHLVSFYRLVQGISRTLQSASRILVTVLHVISWLRRVLVGCESTHLQHPESIPISETTLEISAMHCVLMCKWDRKPLPLYLMFVRGGGSHLFKSTLSVQTSQLAFITIYFDIQFFSYPLSRFSHPFLWVSGWMPSIPSVNNQAPVASP